MARPTTVGELKASGYRPRSVKEEMRANLIRKIAAGEEIFPGIVGYEETVLPQIENAVLSGQDIIFLGERGQAKTRIARALINLLDEEVPILAGSEMNDDPLAPISAAGREAIDDQGDQRRHRVAAARPPLRREAGDAGHHRRRPDRRGRPDQGRRGPLPLRRADDPLRHAAAHQSRRLRHQRAAGPGRADPGRPAQHHGGARRPGPRLQDPPRPRPVRGRQRQPRGLHQPWPDHHAAEGPLRLADPDPLPAHDPARDRHHGAGADRATTAPTSRRSSPTT